MLTVYAFYLFKVLFLKKYFLSRCEYQNKKAMFTDSIFRDNFEFHIHQEIVPLRKTNNNS